MIGSIKLYFIVKDRRIKRLEYHEEERVKARTTRTRTTSRFCFCFCKEEDMGDSSYGYDDGKELFLPLITSIERESEEYNEENDDGSEEDDHLSDNSSLSQDSALSLEYDDGYHLVDDNIW
jgi:hypothetical protein